MKAFDIVGYTFQADNFHPDCVIKELPTGEGQAFDGWKVTDGVRLSVEENLDQIAAAFSIDRMNERSFDSGDFPKVVFSSMVEDASEVCGRCHLPLID